MTGFIPEYVVARVEAVHPKDCPYCQAFPPIPCALHAAKGWYVASTSEPENSHPQGDE